MLQKIQQAISNFFNNTVVDTKYLRDILDEISRRDIHSFRSNISLVKLRDFISPTVEDKTYYQATVLDISSELQYYLILNGVAIMDIYNIVMCMDDTLSNTIFASSNEIGLLQPNIEASKEDVNVIMLLLLRINLKHCYKCLNNLQ